MTGAERVWNYLSGYVIISFKGMGVERVIERALSNGIRLWGVRRTGTREITAATDVAGFYKLKNIVAHTGVSVRIKQKRGAIIALSRMRKRKALIFGTVAALLALTLSTRFIWSVSVEGLDEVRRDTVIEALKSADVGVGSPRAAVGTFQLGTLVMASDERIAWAGVRLEGVVLRVEIEEIPVSADDDVSDEPCSIYASRDGIVTYIEAMHGRPLVHIGDAVKAGQELISGDIERDGAIVMRVRAKGTVEAETLYTASATVGPLIEKETRGAVNESFVGVSVFGRRLYREKTGFFDKVTDTASLLGLLIPVSFERVERAGMRLESVRATLEELELKAENSAYSKLISELSTEARLTSKKTEYIHNEDGSVTAIIRATALQNICEVK